MTSNREAGTHSLLGGLLIFASLLAVFFLAVWFVQVERWPDVTSGTRTPAAAAPGTPREIGAATLDSNFVGSSSLIVFTPTPEPTEPTPTVVVGATVSVAEMLENRVQQEVCTPALPAGWMGYIVRVGDTVSRLAIQTGATIAEITRVNCLQNNLIFYGTQIFLPAAPIVRQPVTECGPPIDWVRYTVQPGDTLYSLARSRGTTILAVQQANCLISTYLFYGRNLYLPAALETTPTSPPPPPPPPSNTPIPLSPTATPTALPPTAAPSLTLTPVPPTPTFTPVSTATVTPAAPTATATFTPLPTATATPLPTATSTPLPTATVTPAPTATFTPLPTATSTAVPTAANTPLPTATSTTAP